MTILVDTRGACYSPGSSELRARYGAALSSEALPDFLVRNVGFIELGFNGDTATIRCAPARIELAGYSRAIRIVHQHNPRRTALSWFDGTWSYEIYPSCTAAAERLTALQLLGDLVERRNFRAYGRCLGSLEAKDPLGDVVSLWRDSSGQLDIAAAREVLNNKIDAKYSVIARDSENGALRFQEFGPGLVIYSGRGNMSVCLGKAVQDQPDYHYGRWIAEGYRDAILANEPMITDMDVIVTDPLNDDKRRLQYRRLTLPVRVSGNTTALLSAVCVDPRIDLSFEVHHKIE